MKKYIYLIFAALSALLLLSACRREQPVEVKKPALKVVSSNVVFGVEGGEGTIVVEADGTVSVTSERPWVQTSVNGNTITVTVSELNPSPQSRYSRLTIQAGSEKTYVTVHQYGEIFDGMKMEDVTVSREGTTMRYAFKANMTVNVSTDQPWVHCALDEENDGIMILTVDENTDFGVRYATVSYTAGSNSGSMKVTQNPKFGAVSGWTVANTGGRFEFPDQIDEITVTPPSDMAEAYYLFHIASVDEFPATDVDAAVEEACLETGAAIRAALASGEIQSVGEIALKGKYVEEYPNLPSASKAFISCFDEAGYPTGQYAFIDVAIPDRGPKKQLVDGWEITHPDGIYERPTQTDQFTITPKPGYEDVKYIATVVKKNEVVDVEDFAFTNFAMSTREEILAKVASGELPSFEAGLFTGANTLTVENTVGDVYVVVVAFGDNQFYTGDYQATEIAVADKMPAYYKWPGKWRVSSDSFSEVWEITIDENNLEKSFFIDGINSITTTSVVNNDADLMVLTYNPDGTVSLKSQKGKEFHYSDSYGTCTMQVQGRITTNGGSSYSRITTMGLNLFTCTLSEDGMTATMAPASVKVTAGTFEFVQFRLWLVRNDTGGTYSLNASSGVIPIPLVMERVE